MEIALQIFAKNELSYMILLGFNTPTEYFIIILKSRSVEKVLNTFKIIHLYKMWGYLS